MKTSRPALALSLTLIACCGILSAQEWGRDATRSVVTVMAVDGKTNRVVLDSARRFDAPSWSPDGSFLILSGGGKLWRISVGGGQEPQPIRSGSAGWIDINHGISPDGKTLAFTSQGKISLFLPLGGGDPQPTPPRAPSYFHGWSPDGKTLVFAGRRNRGCEIFASTAAGGTERPLTKNGGYSDLPSYSPDGSRVYFNADYSGTSDLWRVPSIGGPTQAERIFGDERQNWTPAPRPTASG